MGESERDRAVGRQLPHRDGVQAVSVSGRLRAPRGDARRSVGARRRGGLRLSRRHFLVMVGASVSGLFFGRFEASSSAASRLTGPRAGTYRRLIEALHGAPDRRWRHLESGSATRAFADWYEQQPPSTRQHVDVVLDELEGAGQWRYRDLARMSRPTPDERSVRRCAVVAAALQLAATACDPPVQMGEHPLIASLA
jgi:hypothetical protein